MCSLQVRRPWALPRAEVPRKVKKGLPCCVVVGAGASPQGHGLQSSEVPTPLFSAGPAATGLWKASADFLLSSSSSSSSCFSRFPQNRRPADLNRPRVRTVLRRLGRRLPPKWDSVHPSWLSRQSPQPRVHASLHAATSAG